MHGPFSSARPKSKSRDASQKARRPQRDVSRLLATAARNGLESLESRRLMAVGPVANPGGPYVVNEGNQIVLDGSASSGATGYKWDLNYDGSFSTSVTGKKFTYKAADSFGTRQVALRVTDADGHVDTIATTLTVNDVAPTVTLTGSGTVGEGASYALAWSATDPGKDTITSWIVNWNDGTAPQTFAGATKGATHVFANPGSYTISMTAVDEDGSHGPTTKAITVNDVAPAVTATGAASVNEGSPYTVNFAATKDEVETWVIDWGDDEIEAFNDADLASATHTYADNANRVITVTAVSPDGGSGEATLNVEVKNVKPTVEDHGTPDVSVAEGTTIHQTLTVNDPGADTFTYLWSVELDGEPYYLPDAVVTNASDFTWKPEDNGNFVVTVVVTDDDGGEVLHHAKTIAVTNVAPTGAIARTGSGPVVEGTAVTLTANPADAGADDTFTYQWGVTKDGLPYQLPENIVDDAKTFTFTPRNNGTYVAHVMIMDDDEGEVSVASAAIVATNAAPTATIDGAPSTADEGDEIDVSANVVDAGADDTHTYQWSVERSTGSSGGGGSAQFRRASASEATAQGISTGQAFTVAARVTLDVANMTYGYFAALFDTNDHFWSIGAEKVGSDIQFYGRNAAGTPMFVTATLPAADVDGTPVDIAMTVDGQSGRTRLWLNGEIANENVGPPFDAAVDDAELTVGFNLNFDVDRLGIWDESLASGAIEDLADDIDPANAPIELYEFDEVAGSATVASKGGTGTALTLARVTLTNAPSWTTVALPAGTKVDGSDFTFVPPDNGTYRLKLTVTDSDTAAVSTQTSDIVVSNVAPHAQLAKGEISGKEGSPITFGSASTDAGSADVASLAYAWSVTKDNGPVMLPPGTVIDAASFTFTPTDDGTYVVTLNVTDKDGDSDFKSTSVVVANVDPEATITDAPTDAVDEGSTVTLGSSVTDAGVDDSVATYAWSVTKDGETYELPNGILTDLDTFSFAPGDDGEYVVSLVVTDGDGGVGQATATFGVDNVDPTAVLSGEPDKGIVEGTPVTLAVDGDDVEADSLTYAWSVEKDGEAFDVSDAITDAAIFSFVPADDGEYVATVVVSDDDGGSVTKTSTTISVRNAPPTVTVDAPTTGEEGTAIHVGSAVTDAGKNDTHEYAWTVEKQVGSGTGSLAVTGGLAFAGPTTIAPAFTMNARVRIDKATFTSGIIGRLSGGAGWGWLLSLARNGSNFDLAVQAYDGYSNPTVQATFPASQIVDGEFAAIAVSVDAGASDVKLYLNGAALTVIGGPLAQPNPVTVGTNLVTYVGPQITAEIDAFAVYGSVLEAADVQALHESQAIDATPIHEWLFEDGADATQAANTGSSGVPLNLIYDVAIVPGASWQAVTLPDDVETYGEALDFVPTDDGTYRVKLTVTDSGGLSGTATSGDIIVSNVDPTATIDGASTADEGDEVTLTADAGDAGTDDVLGYAWSVKKGDADYGTAGTNSTYAFTPNDDGSYVVTLTVTDGDGGTVTTTKTITVNNVDPKGGITGAPTVEVNEGTAITLGTDASDVAADTLTYAWGVKKGTATYDLKDADTDQAGFRFTPRDNGTYVVTLVVTDGDGGKLEKTASITVKNAAPTATVTGAPAAEDAIEGATVALTAHPADAGADDTFTYGWSVKKDGVAYTLPAGTTGAATLSFIPNDNGEYVATCVVTDDDGGTFSATSTFDIFNAKPEATIVGAPTTANEGDKITVSADVADAGSADTHAYLWRVEKLGNADFATYTLPAGTKVDGKGFAFTPVDDGTYRIKLAVTDDDGATDSEQTVSIVVANVAPVASINGTSVGIEGTPVLLTSNAVDAGKDDTLVYAWSVKKDGQAYSLANGVVTNAAGFNFTPVDNGNYVVSLTVTDKDGSATQPITHAVTVANAKPTATIAASGAAVEASPMTFTVTAADAGANDTFAYAWTVTKDGKDYPVSASPSILQPVQSQPATLTFTPNDNGVYVVSCLVTDKDGGKVTATKSVTIANVAPTGSISAAPTGVAEGGTVSFAATASDVAGDRDTIAYAWSVARDGKAFALPTSVATNKANFAFVATDNGSYVVTCVVNDEDGGSTGIHSSAFAVANAAPTMTLTGGTASAVRGRDVGFVATVADAGSEDTHSYAWDFGDGMKLKGGTARNHAYAAPGTYTVTMTATDKDGLSVTKTQAVTVSVAATMPDPVDADKQALVIGGTEGADTFKINALSANRIKLYVNTVYIGTFTVTGNIYAYAGDGDNYVKTGQEVTRPVIAFAGNGRDTLIGGAEADVLVGGGGNDAIFGWAGNDVLIGGEGADSLEGEAGDDLLVSGTTAHDADAAKLAAVSREWSRTDLGYAVRVGHVRGTSPGGLNGASVFAGTTVFSDTSIDRLTGGDNRDWFFATTTGATTIRDTLVGLDGAETVN